MESSAFNPNDEKEDKPPIFSSWQQMYIFVLISHTVILLLFYLFSKAFS